MHSHRDAGVAVWNFEDLLPKDEAVSTLVLGLAYIGQTVRGQIGFTTRVIVQRQPLCTRYVVHRLEKYTQPYF